MMALQVPEVSVFLRSRHVQVVDEWTAECLDWLQQEYQGQNVKPAEMKQYVYEQWLDSDLTEIASPGLPQGIAQQRKTLLTGNYALQINSVQDISVPAYGQLLKLQGKENENALVSATQPTQQTQNKFEQKSSRMLMLQLTDGHQSLEGMEYQPILHLTVDTSPGTKILVHGSVQCCLGVLMLTANNVRVLGGDVESLTETNSKIQILSKALGGDGSQVTQQEPVQTTAHQRQPVLQDTIDLTSDTNGRNINNSTMVNEEGNQGQFGDHEEGFFSDELGDDLDALMLNEIQQIEEIEEMDQIQRLASSVEKETEWPADDDDIDEMWLEQVEQTHGAQVRNCPGQNTPTENKAPHQYSIPSSIVKDLNAKTEQVAVGPGNISQSKSKKTGFGARGDPVCESKDHTKTQQQNLNMGNQLVDTKGQGGPANTWDRQDKLNRVKQESGVNKKNICSKANSGIVHRKDAPTKSYERNANFNEFDVTKTRDHQVASVGEIPEETTTALPETKPDVAIQHGNRSPGLSSLLCDSAQPSSIFQNLRTGSTKPAQATGIAAQITKEPPPWTSDNNVAALSRCTTALSVYGQSHTSGSEDTISAAKRRRINSNEGGDCLSVGSSSPVSLSSVMGRIQSRDTFSFTIKGFIITLISPLSRKDGHWSISAKISDKTASLDVDLSNEVLTGLIGFSVPEMMQMKKILKSAEAATAKGLETKLRQGLAQCQKSLIDMHCTMAIKVNLNQQRPLVTSVGATDPADLATNFREVPNKS